MVLFVYKQCEYIIGGVKLKDRMCKLEKNFEMIQRFANERGIEITEDNIIQSPYGGIGLSILHNGKQWIIEMDEYNEKYVLSHLNIGSNKKRKNHYHQHLVSNYYDLIIQHIYTHHNNNERRITKKNIKSIRTENAFEKAKKQRERKEKQEEEEQSSRLRLIK